MQDVPHELHRRLKQAGQDHVLAAWPKLAPAERQVLAEQLESLDLDLLSRLYASRDQQEAVTAEDKIAPITFTPYDATHRSEGEDALRRGEVAALVVAGGQGTRLGFDHPKGMFPIGPVSGKSLFQIHAEKVLATSRRFGRPMPFLIMTSLATHEETVRFFEEHRFFDLPPADVLFFRQGTMPALDLATGKLLLEAPGRLFLSPNGHGGTLLALAETGLLDQMADRGIRHVLYFQVDNPLVNIPDPAFLGIHIRARAQVSTKSIDKDGPLDKLGNLVLVGGRCGMIEYSDLPESLARQTEPDSRLRLRSGNPAIHIFDLDFLRSVATGSARIPFHVARKKVSHVDERGEAIQPDTENALKFEMFIFDVLPRADRWTVVECDRRIEFHPLKNATGIYSPETVRQAISNVAGDWLESAGVSVPRGPDGDVAVPLEISPLFALDASDLSGKVRPDSKITGSTYLE
jgi:UDP-N-acetylglucosamine/UDP-N-acetylgalactosamine diphosphorylase